MNLWCFLSRALSIRASRINSRSSPSYQTPRVDQWLEAHSHVARKIVIPAELKWEVRDKLDQADITERMLYPGLDGLARWLSRYYVRGERGSTP
jgi:hypothetical protein